MNRQSKVYIAGHAGLVGSAILRRYKKEGYRNLLVKTHQELDLINTLKVEELFEKEKPEYVIIAAAKVGGIKANVTYPAEFMYDNLMIQNNIIWSSLKHNVKKLLYIACGCAYPTYSKQPIKEKYLLTDIPEPTNEGFAIAKIAGIKLCEKIYKQYNKIFISCIPANTYGENDHFDENKSHVVTALIKKFYEAKKNKADSVTLWGTGVARREFIYVDDLAEAIFLLMNAYKENDVINIGSGEDVSIRELAEIIKKVVGYSGNILYDASKPNGMLKRTLDSSRIKSIGFHSKIPLFQGVEISYKHFLRSLKS